MKEKKYWIFVVLFIGIFAAINYAAGAKWESRSLAGLQGIAVVVEQIDQEAKRYGLTGEALQADTELKLRQNGIKVFSEQERLQTPEMPQLYINVNVVVREEIEFSAANTHVAFKQVVLLKRDPTNACVATTWEAGGVSMGETADLKGVREDVKALVDQFINDYLAANPKQEKNAKKRSSRDRDVKLPERIEAKVGQDFVITLGSNPTTGYSWRLAEPLPSMLKLQSQRYIPTEPQKIGSGGTEEWIFKSVRSGKVTIMFEYVRPWGKKSPPAMRRSFSIVAK
jgi:predicted secreted protein